MICYTPYQQRIRECFAQAYRFFDKYKYPRTDDNWSIIANDLAQYSTDLFTKDLLVAVLNELEREYNTVAIKQGDGI